MEYKVGRLLELNKEGVLFDELEYAEEAAVANSVDDGIWAVWDLSDGQLVAIAYAQVLFEK